MAQQPETDEITEAEQAVADAEREAAGIAEALLNGDPGATAAAHLAAEEKLERNRGLLATALDFRRRRHEREAERARVQRIEQLDQLIKTRFGEHEGGLISAFDKAVKALTPLVALTVEHNRALGSIIDELNTLGELPQHLRVTGRDLHLTKADVFIGPKDPAQLAAEVVWRALDANGLPGDHRAAGISHDRTTNAHLGIEDGNLSVPPKPAGPSDQIRRVARIVAERSTS